MNANKNVKLEHVIIAYNRFKPEKDGTVKVQLLNRNTRQILAQIFIKKILLDKTFEELQVFMRFKFKREFGFILPKTWTFLGNTV
jgi:hypothetical protein